MYIYIYTVHIPVYIYTHAHTHTFCIYLNTGSHGFVIPTLGIPYTLLCQI